MGAAAVLRVIDCRARVLIPQPSERKRIGNQINAAMIFARADFVNVLWLHRLVKQNHTPDKHKNDGDRKRIPVKPRSN
jgi:hypothetical protein